MATNQSAVSTSTDKGPVSAKSGGGGTHVSIENLSKEFVSRDGRVVYALNNVSATVDPGHFICVIGPSGCGKSTLLNVLAGFEKPSSGVVKIDGEPVSGPKSDHAVIFQDVLGSLMPWLTALQNAELGLKLTKVNRVERRERAKEALESVGLGGSVAAYPFELSGGMQQRVQIARALALRSRLLLMDEPFGALDYFTRSALQTKLESLHRENRFSALLVTHDINEAAMLADKVWIMQGGGHLDEIMDIDIPRPRRTTDPNLVEAIDYLRSKFVTTGAIP